MAEHGVVNAVTSAVTGEVTNRVFAGLVRRWDRDTFNKKLQRLEMLLIKIHSAIETSEKQIIENSWLLRWRDKLKEAASQGDEVLAIFPQQAKDAQDTSEVNINQKQGEAASSSSAAPAEDAGPVSFTRNSVTNMVQGIRNARKMLFLSVDNNMERLDEALKSLERLSPDIREFISLLHLEAFTKVHQAACGTIPSTSVHGPTEMIEGTREKKRMKNSTTHSNPSSPRKEENLNEYGEDGNGGYGEFREAQQVTHDRLEAGFTDICKAVELANSRDFKDLEWLEYWAATLREVKEQGHAHHHFLQARQGESEVSTHDLVSYWLTEQEAKRESDSYLMRRARLSLQSELDALGITGLSRTVNMQIKELTVECDDQENDELGNFLHRLEDLARDVEYFNKLVYLCPTR